MHGEDETSDHPLRIFVDKRWVKEFEGSPTVWIADQSAGVARRKQVTTGQTGGDGTIEIVDGLDISSRVIVSGTEGLKEGTRIEVRQ